jgi:hypothetical protein
MLLFVVEGGYIQQGRKRTSEHHPRGKGGGGGGGPPPPPKNPGPGDGGGRPPPRLITEAIGIAVDRPPNGIAVVFFNFTAKLGEVSREPRDAPGRRLYAGPRRWRPAIGPVTGAQMGIRQSRSMPNGFGITL